MSNEKEQEKINYESDDDSTDKNMEKLIAEKLELDSTGNRIFEFFEFDGDDNCEDNCHGWDGESSRCECTNRRVYWAYDDDNTETSIHPEVY